MASLLDERIDQHEYMDSAYEPANACFIPRAQYQCIANTIVQLIRRSTSGVIAASQPDLVG